MQRDPIGVWGDPVNAGNGYEYVGANPVSYVDPYGLDTAGCDGVPDFLESECLLECCAEHDKCFDDNNCTQSSWLPWSGSDACDACNSDVVKCIIGCIFGGRVASPGVPDYYCRKLHKFITIPGDFPDYATAKIACDPSCPTARPKPPQTPKRKKRRRYKKWGTIAPGYLESRVGEGSGGDLFDPRTLSSLPGDPESRTGEIPGGDLFDSDNLSVFSDPRTMQNSGSSFRFGLTLR
jgi:hypothetical protein